MNCTYTRSIGCTPYEIVFNRKPNYRRIPLLSRAGYEIEDEVVPVDGQDEALQEFIQNHNTDVSDAEVAEMERQIRQQMADRQLAEQLQMFLTMSLLNGLI